MNVSAINTALPLILVSLTVPSMIFLPLLCLRLAKKKCNEKVPTIAMMRMWDLKLLSAQTCFEICRGSLPDRHPYRREVAGGFILADYETTGNSAKSIACREGSCCYCTLPLACGNVRSSFCCREFAGGLPRNVTRLVAVECCPIRDVSSSGKICPNVSDSDLAGETKHGKASC